MPSSSDPPLHPRILDWFRAAHGPFTEAQRLAVPHILKGESVLLASPTGTGKTLAGFLAIIDALLRSHERDGELPDSVTAIYISPLRALTYDIEKNLAAPLSGLGLDKTIRIGVRTGDTPQAERARLRKRPPHLLLTTPESLAIMLCDERSRESLRSCRFVIVDELHALAENKRGAHLAVSLERLDKLVAEKRPAAPLCRVGLSATIAPTALAASFLVGPGRSCHVAVSTDQRQARVEIYSPLKRDPYPRPGQGPTKILEEISRLVTAKRSVLVFTNSRAMAETTALRLLNALPALADKIEVHHSSLDRGLRFDIEDRLKRGELRCVVCSASLELGVDIGAIDLTILLHPPKGVSRALQRIGRSGHSVNAPSHGLFIAAHISELIECVVTAHLVRSGKVEPIRPFANPADIAAQHIIGLAIEGNCTADDIFELLRRTWPFHTLEREKYDEVFRYLEGGGRSLEGQYAQAFGRIKTDAETGFVCVANRKTHRDYLANIGAIPSEGEVAVLLGPRRIGVLDEYFTKRLVPGDIFVIAGRIVKLVKSGIQDITVADAKSSRPNVPAWGHSKLPLSAGLARESVAFRTDLAARLESGEPEERTADWLVETYSIALSHAEAVLRHFQAQRRHSVLPTKSRFVIEIYHDEAESLVHCAFHTLLGRAANDALARITAFRVNKRAGGNAMSTVDDHGFLLTLHPFQIEAMQLSDWQECFSPANAESDLDAVVRDSELVRHQFRAVAQTGLMVPRNNPGAERRLKQLRWSSEILFQVLRQHEPTHPLLQQAIHEAAHNFLDAEGALAFLDSSAGLEWSVRHVKQVTPFAFPLYLNKFKEAMMLENPEEAVERLYRRMAESLGETE